MKSCKPCGFHLPLRLRNPVGIPTAGLVVAMVAFAAPAQTPSQTVPTGQTQAPPVTNLYPSKTVEVSAPPPVAVAGGAQCDTNGNIYLQYYPSVEVINRMVQLHHSVGAPPLRKITVASEKTLEFPVGPFQGYTDSSGLDFYVTPNGAVYNLACGLGSDSELKGHCAWLVTKYNDDASVDSTVRLRVPQGVNLQPSRLAAFLDGKLLVAGFSVDPDTGMRPFAGIFGSSGEFLTNLTLPDDVAPAPAPTKPKEESSAKASESGTTAEANRAGTRLFAAVGGTRIVGAPDGTIYLLRGGSPEKLYTVSSVGEILREQTITPPGHGLSPFDLSVTGQGELFIYYTYAPTGEGASGESALALVDPQSGKVLSTYDVPPKAGVPACMTNGGEILFVRESESGHLAVAGYTPE